MNIQNLLLVGLGGFLGSISRFVVARLVDANITKVFPYGTLTVNIVGSFLLGIIYSLAIRKTGHSGPLSLFMGVGFCGGFTTFSTFAWENLALLQQKNTAETIFYVSLSLIGGVLAVWAGFSLVKNL